MVEEPANGTGDGSTAALIAFQEPCLDLARPRRVAQKPSHCFAAGGILRMGVPIPWSVGGDEQLPRTTGLEGLQELVQGLNSIERQNENGCALGVHR